LAHLFAHFDESGKYKEHPIVAFSGFVDGMERWGTFGGKWVQLLRSCQLKDFHAVRALRYSRPYGNLPKGTSQERTSQILPFIKEIVQGISLGIAVAVDVREYRKVKELHRLYGPDPHYFAFAVAINIILRHFEIPREYTVGLICDDDQEKAIRCYKLLKKLKLNIPEVAKRVTSICFSDDRDTPQVQAADLFAYLSQSEAQRIFAGREYPYQSLFQSFFNVLPSGEYMSLEARFFSENDLRVHVEQRTDAIIFGRRVRLPT
jgi:hypothetical protein